MNVLTNLLKRLAHETPVQEQAPAANPSEVLRVHTDEITGTLELRNLNEETSSPPLRISWVRRDDEGGGPQPKWVASEYMLV